MKKIILALPLVIVLAACEGQTTSQNQATVGGATAGAVVGAAVSNDEDRGKGIVAGAAAGAVLGSLLSRTSQGDCIYERPDGTRYQADCP